MTGPSIEEKLERVGQYIRSALLDQFIGEPSSAVNAYRSYLGLQGIELKDNGDMVRGGTLVGRTDMGSIRWEDGQLFCVVQPVQPIEHISITVTVGKENT